MYSSTPDNSVMYSEECSSSSMLVHRNLTAVSRQAEVEGSFFSFASEEDEHVQFDSKQLVLYYSKFEFHSYQSFDTF